MRSLLINAIFFIFLSLSCFGQKINSNRSLPQVIVFNDNTKAPFSSDELKKLEQVYGDALATEIMDRPNRVLFAKEILRNRVVVKEVSNPKAHKPCPLLSEVPLFDTFVSNLTRDEFFNPKTFNPLKYNFPFYRRGNQLFRVDQTDYFILIKPQHYNN